MKGKAILMALIAVSAPANSARLVGFAGGAALNISMGTSTTTVPDVVGLTAAAADTALEAVSLDTGNVTSTCSAATSGNVVSQSPPAGTVVSQGSLVDLVTSNGTPCTGGGGKLRLRLDLRL